MNPTITFISITTYLAFLIAFGCAIYYWFFRRKYTRERFAFFALTSCISLTIGVVTTIVGKAAVWEQVIILWHYHKTGEIIEPSLDSTQSALCVLLLFGFYLFVSFIFKTWDGSISKDTHLAQKANNDQNLTLLIQESLRLLDKNKLIEEYKPTNFIPKLPNLSQAREPLPWYKFARNFLEINRNALKFEDQLANRTSFLVSGTSRSWTYRCRKMFNHYA